jgi:hypothetical protein
MQSSETLRNSLGLNYKSAVLNQLSYAGVWAFPPSIRVRSVSLLRPLFSDGRHWSGEFLPKSTKIHLRPNNKMVTMRIQCVSLPPQRECGDSSELLNNFWVEESAFPYLTPPGGIQSEQRVLPASIIKKITQDSQHKIRAAMKER